MLDDRQILNNALDAIRAGIDADSQVADERQRNMSYYLGENLGNEVEGRSQVLSRDVFDVVESILPELVKVFATSENYIAFDAFSEEDEEGSKQETDYVNHVFAKKNNGFKILYDWFKDALISKNGIVKCYWEDKSEPRREEYQGLTENELVSLLMHAGDEVKVIEHDSRIESNVMGEMLVYDLTLERENDKSGVCIDVVAPEEFLISRDASSVDLSVCDFMAHRVRRTRSWLRSQGYKEDLIQKVGKGETDGVFNYERTTRFHSEHERVDLDENGDESMIEVWVYEAYMKMDVNEDGISEWWKLVIANETLLEKEEIDRPPFHAITPTPITHKFYGSCPADETVDIQEIKTAHLRQMNDNMYNMNNGRVAVDESVNLDDLLTPRIGGIIRVEGDQGVASHLMPFNTTPMVGDSLNALSYIDKVKEDRTGVSDITQGLDANMLAKTNTGVFNQAEQNSRSRIGLIARIFAETGVKSLFLHIHEILQKHQKKGELVKLRNRWVNVNPSEWRERKDMTIDIGLGTNSQSDKRNGLMVIREMQTQLSSVGLVGPKELYETFAKVCENEGFKNPAMFAINPEQAQLPPPQPDPQAIALEQQMQLAQQQLVQQREKDAAEHERKILELSIKEREMDLKEASQAADNEATVAKINKDIQELQLRREELILKYEVSPNEVEEIKSKEPAQPVHIINDQSGAVASDTITSAVKETAGVIKEAIAPLAQSIIDAETARKRIKVERGNNGDIIGATIEKGDY